MQLVIFSHTSYDESTTMAKRILLVEDHEHIRVALKLLLEKRSHGEYHVQEARDGMEAWNLVQQSQPHLALLDIMIPQLDGISLYRKIIATYELAFPVVFLTAKTDPDTIAQVRAIHPQTPLLPKPVETRILLNTIEQALATHYQD
jgi:CheY-like chemotaxis protein